MSAKIDEKTILKQSELKESAASDSLFGGRSDQSESEMKWVELHKMFDR